MTRALAIILTVTALLLGNGITAGLAACATGEIYR